MCGRRCRSRSFAQFSPVLLLKGRKRFEVARCPSIVSVRGYERSRTTRTVRMPELKCYAYASFYVKRRPELLLFLIRKETPFPGYGGHALDYPYRGLNRARVLTGRLPGVKQSNTKVVHVTSTGKDRTVNENTQRKLLPTNLGRQNASEVVRLWPVSILKAVLRCHSSRGKPVVLQIPSSR